MAGTGGAGALAEYFEGRREKPSSRIYTNLASDPIVSELLRRKEPTYRELALVVSTVVSALDNRIEELETASRPWERLSNTLNAPLLHAEPPGPKDPKGGEAKGADEPDPSEAKWILKYLTLRNLGGVLITVLTLSTGFFAFLNKDYKSIMDAREVRITDLTEEVKVKTKEAQAAKDRLQASEFQRKDLERRLRAADQQVAEDRRKIRELETKRDEAIARGAAGQVQLMRELAEARTKTGDLEKDLQAAQTDLSTTRTNLQTQSASALERARTMSSLQTQRDTAQTQLDSAVDAWNTLLDFLRSRREGSSIEFSTSELRKYLDDLRRLTNKVDGASKRL